MLDTISHPQVSPNTERFDGRINVRPRPSFGLGSLRSRKRLLGIGALVCLAIAALYVAWRPTTYTASSQLLIYIRQVLTGPDQVVLPGRADLSMVQNQIELLRSGNVLAKVVEALELARDPEFVADLSSPSEPKNNGSAQLAPDATTSSAHRAALRALSAKLAVRQVGTSHMVAVSFKASSPDKAARVVNNVIRIYMQERGRASDAASSKAPTLREIHQSLGPTAQVVSEAEPPINADGPPAILILVGAALFGLGAAGAVAIVLDALNDTIRSAHQIEYVLGLECLGVVPRFPSLGAGGEDTAARHLLTSQSPVLRRAAAIIQDVSAGGSRTIGVTSVLPNEGVTTFAIGLAMAAAASGKQVLLIDAVPETPSISRWVAGMACARHRLGPHSEAEAFDDIVQVQDGLHVLPLAELSAGEERLMRCGWLDGILNAAETSYDVVVVDLPSLVAGPQVRAAAQSVDGFLLVVQWGVTKSELVQQAFRSAGQARHKFVGTVLNKADEEAMKRYGHENYDKENIRAVF